MKDIKESLKFSLLGSNSIEIDNLTDSLNQFKNFCTRVHDLRYPGSQTQIIIEKTQPGSFEIDLMVFLALEPNLLNHTLKIASRYVEEEKISNFILAQFDRIIGTKLFSEGKALTNIEKVKVDNIYNFNITNHLGQTRPIESDLIMEDYFKNTNLDKILSSIFRNASERDGVKISSDDGNSIEVNREKCQLLKESTISDIVNLRKVSEDIQTYIFVKKPDLVGNSKWELIYLGQSINAKVSDSDFLDKVRAGKKIGAKDKLKVSLRVTYNVDENELRAKGDENYEILKVL